ncbi:AMP-binding protein [Nocardia rhizosphaerae]|uniref:AMP-binding protein n=1 Tax=Nocardia rhizosphaerae TaxID=1691571 RepID=A0ABV8L729_9NOCA
MTSQRTATATATVIPLHGRILPTGQLSDPDLDRWANRLARLLLERGATAGMRIALAVEPRTEAIVAAAAVRKIGAIPVRSAEGTPVGITTRARLADLDAEVDWLVLDDRSTLRHYLVSSDAPLSDTDLRAVS